MNFYDSHGIIFLMGVLKLCTCRFKKNDILISETHKGLGMDSETVFWVRRAQLLNWARK